MIRLNLFLSILNIFVIFGCIFQQHSIDPLNNTDLIRSLIFTLPLTIFTLVKNKVMLSFTTSIFILCVIFDHFRGPEPKKICELPFIPQRINKPFKTIWIPYGYKKDDIWRFIDQLYCIENPFDYDNVILIPELFNHPNSPNYIEQDGDKDYLISLGDSVEYKIIRPDYNGCELFDVKNFDGITRFSNSGSLIKGSFYGDIPSKSLVINNVIERAAYLNCDLILP